MTDDIPEDDLEWLNTYWHFYLDGKRIGDIFCEEMNGFKYKSAKEIIAMFRGQQNEKVD